MRQPRTHHFSGSNAMKALRLLLIVPLFLLSGCLVVFNQPLPNPEPAPLGLLGEWTRSNEWGEQLFLDIRQQSPNLYRARIFVGSPENPEGAEQYLFTVVEHGRRWYFSIALPRRFGDSFAIGGFEIDRDNQLQLFSLDHDRVFEAIAAGNLQGRAVETPGGEGALVTSSPEQVLAFLNDPVNSDLFVEAALYQRSVE
jgi:hypothetical protein